MQDLNGLLTQNEGKVNKVYFDSLGITTIGVGRNLRDVGLSPSEYQSIFSTTSSSSGFIQWKDLSVANKSYLMHVGITDEDVNLLLDNDIAKTLQDIQNNLKDIYDKLNPARQYVIVDMVFNMGINSFLGFHTLLSYLANGDYLNASEDMLKSEWSKEVGARSTRDALAMKTGETSDLFIG